MENPTASKSDVQKYFDINWIHIIKDCRRRVPDAKILLLRFNKFVEVFATISDKKTGHPLFNEHAMEECDNLRTHIEMGCLSDPDIDLYFLSEGNSNEVLCIRGSNKNENYHRHVRNVCGSYTAGTMYIHTQLMEFNHQWTIKMMFAHQGLPEHYSKFFRQEVSDWYYVNTNLIFKNML